MRLGIRSFKWGKTVLLSVLCCVFQLASLDPVYAASSSSLDLSGFAMTDLQSMRGTLSLSTVSVDRDEVQTISSRSPVDSTMVTVPATSVGAGGTFTVNPGDSPATILSRAVAVPAIGSSANLVVTGLDDSYVYTTDTGGHFVYVIRTSDNTVVQTVSVGNGPNEAAVSPDGARAYVSNTLDGTVSVIRTSDNTVLSTIPVGAYPTGIAITPDSSKIYVSNYNSGTVSVIDASTQTVVSTVTVGSQPVRVTALPDGSKVYVTNFAGNTVSVIRTSDNTVVATIPSVPGARATVPSPDASKIYVSSATNNNVSVIRTSDNTVVATIPVGNLPYRMTINRDGSYVYTSNQSSGTISVISTATNTVVASIAIGPSPLGIALSQDGLHGYVVSSTAKTLAIFNTADNTLADTVSVGGTQLYGAGVSPNSTYTFSFQGSLAKTDIPQLTVSSPSWDYSTLTNGSAKAYATSGTANTSITPQAGQLMDWESASIASTIPNGTNLGATYSTDNATFVSDIAALPASETLYLRFSLSTTNTTRSPSLDSVSIGYRRHVIVSLVSVSSSKANPVAVAEGMVTINSGKATFSGVSDPGNTVTVTVHSDPIACSAVADSQGRWSCTTLRSIPVGNHTILVEAVTSQGERVSQAPVALRVLDSLAATGENTQSVQLLGGIIGIMACAGFLLSRSKGFKA